ncbi:MAG: hypothetical protein NWS93_01235 [Schleiferiaceae bacterium]|nr:hypothetical protein [Schleiferiaceae bacterium]
MSMHPFELLRREISVADFFASYADFFAKIKAYRWFILIGLLLGFGGGAIWGLLHPPKYKAEVMIAVEDDDSSGWQNLLQQFGIDMGGNNPGGIFKGESLVQLFKTRGQIERTLLREVEIIEGEKPEVLANAVFRNSKLTKKSVFEGITFTSDRSQFTPLQDSLLMLLHEEVRDEMLQVVKPENKLSIILLSITGRDKNLARALAVTAVNNTAEFYVETLSKKARLNLEVLRREADSVNSVLNGNLGSSAYYSDININPGRASLGVSQNRSLIDLQVSVALYGEIIKNLKLAEIGLRKETPLIQLVDMPSFPLPQVGFRWWEFAMGGLALSLVLVLVVLAFIPYGGDRTA